MKISDQQIEQIREATNIVDLVGEHVRLRKRGRNWTGLCPFHSEKTPSFSVLEDRGIFKCFGCGKGGDVFSFVMQMEGLTFPEAAERLAKRANIELQNVSSDEDDRIKSEREGIYEALRAAYILYFQTLRAPEGKRAMDYLKQRGLKDEIIQKFGLGYAPEQSGWLTNALTKKGYSQQALEAGGLIARRDNGETYERFRGRVIFPVLSATGKVVGFGGRIMPGAPEKLAKYINSPDTQVYHKSQILYGLFQAKDAIRRKGFAVLVEGYADVLAVFQSGVENVVAASGTSLTADQLGLLKRYTTSIVLVFDSDKAGNAATFRGIDLALEAGFDVYTALLPAGEDPDTFIRTKGREAFEAYLDQRQPWIERKAQWFEEQGSLNDPAHLTSAIRSILETVYKVPDEFKRSMIIDRLALRFKALSGPLYSELQRLKDSKSLPQAKAAHADPIKDSAGRDEKAVAQGLTADTNNFGYRSDAESLDIPAAEASLLASMIEDPRGVARLIDETTFDLELITHPSVREVISFLMQEMESGEVPTIAQLLDEYREKPEYDLLVRFGMTEHTFSDRWDADVEDAASAPETKARQAMAKMELARKEQELTLVRQRLSRVSSEDDIATLLRESDVLAQRIQLLKQTSFVPMVPVIPDAT